MPVPRGLLIILLVLLLLPLLLINTHNRGIAATTADAGTGYFSSFYPRYIFARATRLLILLLLLLLNMLKQV